MSPRVKSALVLGAVFLLGAVAGGGLATARSARRMQEMVEAPPGAFRQRAILRGLERAVDLDEAQREQVVAILERHAGEAEEMRRELKPRLGELQIQTLEEIRRLMRPEQLPRFERFVERAKARQKRPPKPRAP
jgi:hypothetical protein